MLLTHLSFNKDIKKQKKNVFLANHFHNTLRRLDVSPNFPITRSEAICGYYLYIRYIRAAS